MAAEIKSKKTYIDFKFLKKKRLAMGYTQKQFAQVLNVKSYQTIATWESGKNTPKAEEMRKKICHALGISMNELLGKNAEDTRTESIAEIILHGMLSAQKINEILCEEIEEHNLSEQKKAAYEYAADLACQLKDSLWKLYRPLI